MNSKINKYEFQWGERHSIISAECWADYYGHYLLGTPKHIDYIEISEGRYLQTYASDKMIMEWKKNSKMLLKKNKRNSLLRSSQIAQKKYWDFFKKTQKVNLPTIENEKLYKLLQEYIQIYKGVIRYFPISQAESVDSILKYLHAQLTKINEDALLNKLITQTIPDIINIEQKELSALGENHFISDKILYSHAIKHAWLFFNSYNTNDNLKFLRNGLQNHFDYNEKITQLDQLKKYQTEIFKKIKNQKIKELCLFLQTIGVDRLNLKNCWAGAEFRFLPIFKEIAKRTSISLEEVMASYSIADYRNFLIFNKKLSKEKIENRTKEFVWWKNNNKLFLIEKHDKITKLVGLTKGPKEKNLSSEIRGMIANKGKVSGVVRIVKSIDIAEVLKDLERFKQGDILVTWMTQPNMVPIAKLAGAIVADEGGITSHAAIIAREFGVPCIVGTKNSTKILKDGDMVEVDADNGIVKIIERAK